MSTHHDDNYTDPKLRDKLKDEIMAGDRGGKPGQWSARKAQLLAHEYEAQGGGYKGPRTEEQEHLHQWTEEEWTNKEGSANATDARGETHRYLPKEAWDKLSPSEREATDKAKVKGARQGKQHVPNTVAAAEAGHAARQAHEGHQQHEGHKSDASKSDK